MRRFALSGNLSFSLAKSPRRFFYHFPCRRVLHSRQFSLWLLSSLRCNLKQLTQWDGTIVQRAAALGYFKCLLYISMYFHSQQFPWTLHFRYSFLRSLRMRICTRVSRSLLSQCRQWLKRCRGFVCGIEVFESDVDHFLTLTQSIEVFIVVISISIFN